MGWFFKKKKDKEKDVKQPEEELEVVEEPPVVEEPEPQPEPEEEQSVFATEPVSEPEPAEEPEEKKGSWFSRLTEGLTKSSSKITEGISSLITKRKLDDDLLEELEEILIMADLGPATAARLVEDLSKDRYGKEVTDEDVKHILADSAQAILEPVSQKLTVDPAHKPFVILMTGVNGAGKTTTIGKMAKLLQAEGKSVMLAAGDTFRAAAVEQLTIWGERSGVPVYTKPIGSDAAALAYEAYEEAKKNGVDVLLVDTAGRLQNKANLMAELEKIVRVLQKHDEEAPHARLIVLDATTGQNAHSQLDAFKKTVDLTGMVITKLDGSAKGGVVVSLADQFALPIHAIGVGEKIDDLRPFAARDFALSLMGLEKD